MSVALDNDSASLRYLLRLEKVLSTAAMRFVAPSAIDEAIDAALADAGELVGADRAYLFQFAEDGAIMNNTHEWCASGVSAQIDNLQALASADFPWMAAKLRAGQPFQIENVAALPAAAGAERQVLEAQDIRSCLIMPIQTTGKLAGFVGFDNVRAPEAWRTEHVELLSIIGQLTGNVLEREATYRELELSNARQQAILENLPDIAWLKDDQSRYLAVNETYSQSCGLAVEAVIGKTDPDIWPAELAEKYRGDDAEVMRSRQRKRMEERVEDHKRGERWVETIKTPVVDGNGEIIGTTGIARDITERKQAEQALREEREKVLVTLRSIGDAVITTDANGQVEFMNPVAEKLTGWHHSEARGRPLSEVLRLLDAQRQPIENPLSSTLSDGETVEFEHHTLLVGRDGNEFSIQASAAPIRDHEGRLHGVVIVFKDVTEQRQLSQRLQHQATHDSLTGLVNRKEFEDRLEHAIVAFHTHRTPYVLCYLDLDQFKVVNDTAGHSAGDEMLKQIAALLQTRIRSRDTLGRLGGDEFSLLLENCPLGKALEIAENLIATIGEYRFTWGERRFAVGVSIGLVPISKEVTDRAQLMTQADVACFTAKDLGRNRVSIYHADDSELSQRHRDILRAAELREALEQNCFQLYAQPIGDTRDPGGRVIHHEVLVRLLDRHGELLLPGSFIPAAERFGLMMELDRWVISEALRQYSGFGMKDGADVPGIAINLSGDSLGDDRLVDFVRAELAATGVPASRVCFEVTETAAINRLAMAQTVITELGQLGCRFALDDFGSGLSSFAYLKHLPVDYLKIDGSFIRDVHKDEVDRAMVRSIKEIGHTLGIATVAEWVESEEILAAVRAIGIDFAQGYAIGRPTLLQSLGKQEEGL